ncbi:hypothetical protein [Ideonella sp.]|uniref:hypothetical protein n=1 Tax=Ideonella sp. TaxID=1929293 RepID=UPI0035B21972
MRRWKTRSLTLSAACLGLLAAPAVMAAPTYRIELIPKAHGVAPKTPNAISDNGNIVGQGYDSETGQTLKFVSRNGKKVEALSNTNGPTFGGPPDVNNAGTVVGRYLNGDGQERGGMWSIDGTLTDLGEVVGCAEPQGAYPSAINKAGEVVLHVDCHIDGVKVNGGVLLRNGVSTMMPSLEGGSTYPYAMSNAGHVTGSSMVQVNGSAVQQAFIWQDGQPMRPLGTKGEESSGYAVNDKGHVIGVVGRGIDARPFLYKGAALRELPKCDDSRLFWPVAISNDDSIVGYYQWSGPTQTGLIQNGQCALLQTLLDDSGAGWTDLLAQDMNNDGVIVGSGRYQGHRRAFIATPLSR